jgi:PEP-CTERM motif
MKIIRNLTAVATMAAALTFAVQARADVISFYLATAEGSTTTTPTMGGSPAPDPQVEVIVDELTNTTATVEFLFGTHVPAPVGINVDGTFDVTGITNSGTGNGHSLPCTDPGTCSGGNTSHAGSFNFETSAVTADSITIDLLATGSTTWADAADVLIANVDGWEAADNMASNPQDLGYYATTPLPAALPLFTSGLGALGFLGWRRKRKNAAALAAA